MEEKKLMSVQSVMTRNGYSTTVEFKVIAPDGNSIGKLDLPPDMPAVESKQMIASLNMMIAHAAGEEKTDKIKMWMMCEALRRNRVTCKELVDAFWKAYGDQYVSQGRIEFRHLWKYIEQQRNIPSYWKEL